MLDFTQYLMGKQEVNNFVDNFISPIECKQQGCFK